MFNCSKFEVLLLRIVSTLSRTSHKHIISLATIAVFFFFYCSEEFLKYRSGLVSVSIQTIWIRVPELVPLITASIAKQLNKLCTARPPRQVKNSSFRKSRGVAPKRKTWACADVVVFHKPVDTNKRVIWALERYCLYNNHVLFVHVCVCVRCIWCCRMSIVRVEWLYKIYRKENSNDDFRSTRENMN